MDPVFTLQWCEFLVAQELQRLFPKSKHYSVLVPTSRQEKGIDLALVRKQPGEKSRVALIQVKSSRTYMSEPPMRTATRRYRYFTWFNRFDPSPEADFFVLIGMYAPDPSRTKSVNAAWYKHCTLLLTFTEMEELMRSCLTVGGRPDRMFGFGFDSEDEIVQTRGDQHRQFKDFTACLLQRRQALLGQHLEA